MHLAALNELGPCWTWWTPATRSAARSSVGCGHRLPLAGLRVQRLAGVLQVILVVVLQLTHLLVGVVQIIIVVLQQRP